MDAATRLIHLLALAAYFGATLDLVLVFLPAVEVEPDPARQRRVLARGLRAYNVLSVGALGALVISGASGLTDLKGRLLQDYARLLWPLVRKLSLAFALIMVGTYLAFGLAHRLVRAELGGLPVDVERQRAIVRRMRATAWVALGLAVWTAWAGIRLAP
ncbi:MAG TPA: hypothetical protein VKW76_00830 [Candidatus Binatia bacterium]|nr:hypothetical protein [Candidatus Binatia bacterium]